VRIWDPPTGQQRAILPSQQRAALTGHAGRVTAVAIAPDGTWLARGDGGGTVRIWDPATRQQHAALTGHAGPVTAVAIAPDGTWLATAGRDGSVRIWDPATGGISAAMQVDSRLEDCAWSPSSRSSLLKFALRSGTGGAA
jgi:WD40 repeat protein